MRRKEERERDEAAREKKRRKRKRKAEVRSCLGGNTEVCTTMNLGSYVSKALIETEVKKKKS